MQSGLILWTLLATTPAWAQEPPDAVIEAARNSAAGFARASRLHCQTGSTTRDRGARPDRRSRPDPDAVFWQTLDTVTGVVTAEHGQEVYSEDHGEWQAREESPGQRRARSAGEFFRGAAGNAGAEECGHLFANQTPDLDQGPFRIPV